MATIMDEPVCELIGFDNNGIFVGRATGNIDGWVVNGDTFTPTQTEAETILRKCGAVVINPEAVRKEGP